MYCLADSSLRADDKARADPSSPIAVPRERGDSDYYEADSNRERGRFAADGLVLYCTAYSYHTVHI